MKYSTKAWIAVGLVVVVADVLAPPNDTLSEAVDRALEHPLGKVLAPWAIYHVADHLTNRLDERMDLLHLGFEFLRTHVKRVDNSRMQSKPRVEL